MPTRKEHEDQANREFHLLNKHWHELFMGDNMEELWERDLNHPPVSLRAVVEAVLTEGVTYINDVVTPYQLENDEESRAMSRFDLATSNLLTMARAVAIRMYFLGNKAPDELHFNNLTECPCRVLMDDEITELLRQAVIKDLEGDTWVIKNFDPDHSE